LRLSRPNPDAGAGAGGAGGAGGDAAEVVAVHIIETGVVIELQEAYAPFVRDLPESMVADAQQRWPAFAADVPGKERVRLEGYDGDLLWTKNNDYARPNYNWARWYPKLKAGRYEVFVYIPHRFTTTAQARYWVSHAGGYTRRIVDQSAYSNQWVSLGTYRFAGTDEDYVSLADVTGEAYLTTLIAWDAAKFEKR
ncbi:MAG TPA: hypothetical protein VLC95_08135, partial [Anaerolineae bacterium]|nr:hypothetical protein [Anaerolineae bacterium]